MYSQKDVINKIIPADDLYWDDYENKYIALNNDEIDDIICKCFDNAITEETSIMKVLNWCTSVRVGQLLMKNFLAGSIAIKTIDSDDEPVFMQNKDGNI